MHIHVNYTKTWRIDKAHKVMETIYLHERFEARRQKGILIHMSIINKQFYVRAYVRKITYHINRMYTYK